MTERTKTIKGLISGQVDIGTFGLVELELLAIENENEALRKHAVMQQSEQLAAFLQNVIGKKYSIYFEQQDIDGLIEAANYT